MADPSYRAVILAVRALFQTLGLRFTVTGQEHVPRTGGAVMAVNHIGYLDFMFAGLAAYPQRLVRFMAKKEVFDHPVAGPVMRSMRHIRVDRTGVAADAYREAVAALRRGEIVGVFPEATISESYELKEFKTGAVRMAAEADVPLLPVVVWGSQRVLTKGRRPDLRRGRPVRIVVGEPFRPPAGADALDVTRELKARMSTLLDEARATYDGTPDGPDDTWWIPVRLGGTAPTIEEAAQINARRMAERAARKAERAARRSRRRAPDGQARSRN